MKDRRSQGNHFCYWRGELRPHWNEKKPKHFYYQCSLSKKPCEFDDFRSFEEDCNFIRRIRKILDKLRRGGKRTVKQRMELVDLKDFHFLRFAYYNVEHYPNTGIGGWFYGMMFDDHSSLHVGELQTWVSRFLIKECRKDDSCPYKALLPEYELEEVTVIVEGNKLQVEEKNVTPSKPDKKQVWSWRMECPETMVAEQQEIVEESKDGIALKCKGCGFIHVHEFGEINNMATSFYHPPDPNKNISMRSLVGLIRRARARA